MSADGYRDGAAVSRKRSRGNRDRPLPALVPRSGRPIALGIGINSGIFAVLNGLLFHAIVRSLDPGLVTNVIPLEANLAWWRGLSSTVTTLGAELGALALVLASVGIYGVVTYAVTPR